MSHSEKQSSVFAGLLL